MRERACDSGVCCPVMVQSMHPHSPGFRYWLTDASMRPKTCSNCWAERVLFSTKLEFRIETTSLHWVTKGSLRMKLLGRRKGLGHITEIGFGWRCLNVEANHAWKLYYSGNFSYRRNKLFFSQHLCGLSLCNSLTDNRNNPDWHIRSTNELVAKRLFKLGFSDCTAYCTTSQFKGEFLMQKNMTKKVTSSNFDLPLCSTYCFLFLAKLG